MDGTRLARGTAHRTSRERAEQDTTASAPRPRSAAGAGAHHHTHTQTQSSHADNTSRAATREDPRDGPSPRTRPRQARRGPCRRPQTIIPAGDSVPSITAIPPPVPPPPSASASTCDASSSDIDMDSTKPSSHCTNWGRRAGDRTPAAANGRERAFLKSARGHRRRRARPLRPASVLLPTEPSFHCCSARLPTSPPPAAIVGEAAARRHPSSNVLLCLAAAPPRAAHRAPGRRCVPSSAGPRTRILVSQPPLPLRAARVDGAPSGARGRELRAPLSPQAAAGLPATSACVRQPVTYEPFSSWRAGLVAATAATEPLLTGNWLGSLLSPVPRALTSDIHPAAPGPRRITVRRCLHLRLHGQVRNAFTACASSLRVHVPAKKPVV